MRRLGCNEVASPNIPVTRASTAENSMVSGPSLPLKLATADNDFLAPFCPAALEVDTEEPSALHDAIVWPHGTERQPSFADLSPGSPRRTALKLGHSRAFILVDLVLSSGR